jgi:hypothetical protein
MQGYPRAPFRPMHLRTTHTVDTTVSAGAALCPHSHGRAKRQRAVRIACFIRSGKCFADASRMIFPMSS